ncbi:MAG: hypothetical protein KME53_09845 [Candidatus Thiodiazotropha sp. (ex Clathrolucina costata)]|nr:hypothetical protein [Candidatus Thiodiazotropha taylori]
MENGDIDMHELVVGKYVPPMFHPIHERDVGAWIPSNDAACIASNISHTWEDIHCLFKIRKKTNSEYENKLLFKYIVIELRSVIEQLEKLQAIIFKIVKDDKNKDKVMNGYLTKQDADNIKILFKSYHNVKKGLEKDIIDIRNNIGAHRDNHPWTDIMGSWDKLDPEIFKPLFLVIPKLFDYIVKLEIFDWSRKPSEDSIEICCSGLNRP